MKEQLAALYALQQLDSALAAMQKQYAALDPGRAENAALQSAQAAYKEAETILHKTSGDLRDVELEQKAVETKAADFEKKLYGGTVRVAKELQAMQDEIEMLKRRRSVLDERILTLMDELEAARQSEASTRQTLTTAQAAMAEKQAAYKKEADTMKAQARVLVAQRAEAAKPIEPNLLKRYDSLRASKGGIAIAALEDGNACGGCKMGLPSSLVENVLTAKSVTLCDNCGRMLYAPDK